MKFNHLIEINDPLNPLADFLTRNQLWRGLVLRAEAPQVFIPWLEACTILDRSEDGLSRELRFPNLVIRDRVTFFPQDKIIYAVPNQKDIQASTLIMSIEEPQPEMLCVRFEYDDGKTEAEDVSDDFYNEYRRSAYVEADIDTIRIIRQLNVEGRFDRPIV